MSWHTMLEFVPPLIGCVVSNRDYSYGRLKRRASASSTSPPSNWPKRSSAAATPAAPPSTSSPPSASRRKTRNRSPRRSSPSATPASNAAWPIRAWSMPTASSCSKRCRPGSIPQERRRGPSIIAAGPLHGRRRREIRLPSEMLWSPCAAPDSGECLSIVVLLIATAAARRHRFSNRTRNALRQREDGHRRRRGRATPAHLGARHPHQGHRLLGRLLLLPPLQRPRPARQRGNFRYISKIETNADGRMLIGFPQHAGEPAANLGQEFCPLGRQRAREIDLNSSRRSAIACTAAGTLLIWILCVGGFCGAETCQRATGRIPRQSQEPLSANDIKWHAACTGSPGNPHGTARWNYSGMSISRNLTRSSTKLFDP